MSSPRNLTWPLVEQHVVEGHGSETAILEMNRSWTYGQLAAEMGRAAAALTQAGLKAGDRAALFMHDSAELAACFLGALRLGVLPVPISTLLRGQDIRAELENADPQLVIAHGDQLTHLEGVVNEIPGHPRLVAVSEFVAGVGYPDPLPPCHEGDWPIFLLYSGNPSCLARGVPTTARAVLAAHQSWSVGVLGLKRGDRVFSTVRLPSAFGLGAGLLFPLLAGATTCLHAERMQPRVIFDAMIAFRPTVFCAVPSLYRQIIDDLASLGATGPQYFGSVRLAFSGAEPLTAGLFNRIRTGLGIELIHGYGATEAMHTVISSRPGQSRPGAVGRLLEGFETRIVDAHGKTVGPEDLGVLQVRGPSVATGYWRAEAEEREAFWPGGWFHTRDRFFRDEEGWYYHCGRTDDLFKVSGKWVSPEDIERTLLGHPAIWECAVTGEEDDDGLMIPAAYVVCNVGFRPSVELGRELMEFVKARISPYKSPRRVRFVDELPKDGQGKVQRWRLRRPSR